MRRCTASSEFILASDPVRFLFALAPLYFQYIFSHILAHAKGVLLRGTFAPTKEAAELSRAQHFTETETPVLARFSSSTGIPKLPDTDPNGNPRGFAVRFQLAETPRRIHTDIVAHSVPLFPAATIDEALAFFQSVADGSVGSYVASHPAALEFAQALKPTPVSFGTEKYHAVSAFKLINSDNKATFVRYSWLPVAGEKYLSEEEVQGKGPNFLYEAVPEKLAEGPIKFQLVVQVAEDGDVTDDNTVHWPSDRKVVELGILTLTDVVDNDAEEQKHTIFDPVPRVDGVEPSADPLLELRAAIYLKTGRSRRAA